MLRSAPVNRASATRVQSAGRTPAAVRSRATERSVAPLRTLSANVGCGRGSGRSSTHQYTPAPMASKANMNQASRRSTRHHAIRKRTTDYNGSMQTFPPEPRPRGFTLIEIMVVIVILGILAALVVPRVLERPDEARVIAAKNDIAAIMQE